MDGWITIGTDLSTDKFEKKLIKLQEKYKRKEIEIDLTVKNLNREEEKLESLKSSANDLDNKYSDINKKIKEQNNLISQITYKNEQGNTLIPMENVEQYNRALKEIENLRGEQNALLPQQNEINAEIEKQEKIVSNISTKYERQKSQLQEIRNEVETIFQEQKHNQTTQIAKTVENIGNSISKVTKKVIRWGIAIFGVRSAYMFVRQAMSTIAQYDDQLATDIQYIRFAIAMTLERYIKPLIEWVFKLLQYVNYLTMAWFKINLFEKATVNAFNKSNKSAEKLKKTLAGFDEMNILSDNDSNSSNIGGIPSQDLSNMQNFKAPKWLEWIKDHGNEIKNIIIGIAGALALIKFAKLLVWGSELTGILGTLLQIGIITIGVELLYTALTGRELISDIMEIKKGLEDLNKIRKEQNKQAKASQENTKKMIKTYNDVAESTGVTKEQTEQYVNTLLEGIKTNDNLIESMEKQKNWLGALNGDNKKLTNSQNEYNKTIQIQLEELKKLYDRGELNNKQKAIYQSLLEKNIGKLQETNANLNKNSDEYKKNTEKIKETKTELERITGRNYEIKTSIQTPNTNAFENSIRNLLNKVSNWFNNFGELKIGFGWGSGGGGFRAKGGIYYPKLAAGGIINMPGRGVPYHGATIGERGAEAVVPLTDSQQMALLGEAIGKYITVNATIVNSMNGRVLNRELQKIQNQSSFATNGR